MNRCTDSSSWTRRRALTLTLAGALLATSLASAQQAVRPFPPQTQRGTLQVTNPPEVLLDGKAERLSPGARIRGVNNLLVMSGAIVGQSLVVAYVRNPLGQLHDIWVLNATEARLPMTGAPAASNITNADYGPAANGTGNATTLSSDTQQ
jgi:hypothetical protein